MKLSGEFRVVLDLGQLDKHSAMVYWHGTRAESSLEANTMIISSVLVDIGGQVIDVRNLLSDYYIEEMRIKAWHHFPALAVMQARRAESDTDFAMINGVMA